MRQVAYYDLQFFEAQHPNQRLRRQFVSQKEVSNQHNVKRELFSNDAFKLLNDNSVDIRERERITLFFS
jgi:hypothetical protein